jgi:hypothetical protein
MSRQLDCYAKHGFERDMEQRTQKRLNALALQEAKLDL